MVSLTISFFTASIGFMAIPEGGDHGYWIFLAFLYGLIFTNSIFFGIVDSAVKTCIVCFAESPAEFEQNHPQLFLELRESAAWYEDDMP